MRQRCNNPRSYSYKKYGAKGIDVCQEWEKFVPFWHWASENGYNDSLTLDRIDGSQGYCPENCRWVDYKTQARNRANNRYYESESTKESHMLCEWSEKTGISRETLYARIQIYGWSVDRAINTPVMKKRPYPKRKNLHVKEL